MDFRRKDYLSFEFEWSLELRYGWRCQECLGAVVSVGSLNTRRRDVYEALKPFLNPGAAYNSVLGRMP